MDVSELLNYEPATSVRDPSEPPIKRSKESKDGIPVDLDQAAAAIPALDETTLRRLLAQFERRVLKNQELRVKFNENPTKFMDSEMELFEVIQEMHVLSTQPELYRTVVDQNMVPTILGLLSHENSDISCAAVSLLQELCDLDDVTEIEKMGVFLDALIDGQVIAQLVSNMDRLDESIKEEAEGVYNSLAIIENLTDFKPGLSKDAQPLMVWILKRFGAKIPFDGNKLYSSEILSIMLQNSEENRNILGDLKGVDILLQQLAFYKRRDPVSGDEHEFLANILDCLCSSLLCCPSNRELFYLGEGIELMNLILKEKRNVDSSIKSGALKILNHVLSTDKGIDEMLSKCCDKLVEIQGLRVLFPIFMKPKSIISQRVKKREIPTAVDDIEEHTVSIFLSLLRFCQQEMKRRIVAKFAEGDLEKTERLVEMHFKYSEKLSQVDQKIQEEKDELEEDEEIDEDEVFVKRLTEGGLFTLQMVDQTIAMILSLQQSLLAENTIRIRVNKILDMHASLPNNPRQVIQQVLTQMASEQKESEEKNRIIELSKEFSS